MSAEKRERVVVGVDGSNHSVRALHWALDYARKTGAAVEAVHGWQIPVSYGVPVAVLPDEDFGARAEEALRETVDGALGGDTDVEVERVAEMGYPPKVLVERARSADLLVVGSRGHGGLVGTLIGSVSLHCVAHAACPLVVVRGEG